MLACGPLVHPWLGTMAWERTCTRSQPCDSCGSSWPWPNLLQQAVPLLFGSTVGCLCGWKPATSVLEPAAGEGALLPCKSTTSMAFPNSSHAVFKVRKCPTRINMKVKALMFETITRKQSSKTDVIVSVDCTDNITIPHCTECSVMRRVTRGVKGHGSP